MLRVNGACLKRSFETLAECGGAAERECVVYWVAAVEAPDEVIEVVHPIHFATPHHYEIDERWLQQFWVMLGREGLTARAQVHTHRIEAFHSITDDLWPLVHSPGFLSLVLANGGSNTPPLQDSYLAEMTSTGWERRAVDQALGIECDE